jgi:hypothetical protein
MPAWEWPRRACEFCLLEVQMGKIVYGAVQEVTCRCKTLQVGIKTEMCKHHADEIGVGPVERIDLR